MDHTASVPNEVFLQEAMDYTASVPNEILVQNAMDYTASVPNEILVHVFAYLPVRDIVSCRQVCRKWYSACNTWSIRKNEKHVFRSVVLTSAEINDILVNHGATQMSIEFISVKLDEICFEEIGKKIRVLELTECFFKSLTNLFLYAPYIESFIYCWHSDSGYGEMKLTKLASDLYKNHRVMSTLKKLECIGPESQKHDQNNESLTKLFPRVFPNLISIRLPQVLSNLNENVRCLVEQNQVKELMGVLFPPYYNQEGNDEEGNLRLANYIIISLPRLTTLEVSLDLELPQSLNFFSRQNSLETLRLRYYTVHENDPETKCIKQLLFHILANCKRLKSLRFYLAELNYLHFNKTDLEQLKKILAACDPKTYLSMAPITIDGGTPTPFYALFDKLTNVEVDSGNNYHHQGPPSCYRSSLMALETTKDIINSQKNLSRYAMNVCQRTFHHDAAGILPDIQKLVLVKNLQSDSLQHLELNFNRWTFTMTDTLTSWEFPNLLTLKLGGLFGMDAAKCMASGELDLTQFRNWILSMPLLKQIELRWFSLDEFYCTYLCSKLPQLETLIYEASVVPKRCNMKLLFDACPALRKVAVDKGYRTHYIMSRSKNIIYSRKSVYQPFKRYHWAQN